MYDLVGIWFPELCYFKVRSPLVHLIPHSLELNHIRTVIEKDAGLTILRWHSESYLRSLPRRDFLEGRCAYKIPDAIFWHRRQDGTERQFFIEYERSLKSTDRYVQIMCDYASREGITEESILYICHTKLIRRKLFDIAQGRQVRAEKYFQFLILEGFYDHHVKKKAAKQEENVQKDQAIQPA